MNRQLRAARRVRCEQLRYVVIISVRSCQCHRTRSSFQVAAKSRTSRFETTIEDENRDEKMIRTKSNRIEFPFTNGRFESKTTRVQLTRARPHASTCHVGNDALPLLFHRSIRAIPTIGVYFRDLSSLVVDEITRLALTEFASTWFYTGQSHPLFASAAEKSIAGFRDAIFSNIVIVVCTFVVSHGA